MEHLAEKFQKCSPPSDLGPSALYLRLSPVRPHDSQYSSTGPGPPLTTSPLILEPPPQPLTLLLVAPPIVCLELASTRCPRRLQLYVSRRRRIPVHRQRAVCLQTLPFIQRACSGPSQRLVPHAKPRTAAPACRPPVLTELRACTAPTTTLHETRGLLRSHEVTRRRIARVCGLLSLLPLQDRPHHATHILRALFIPSTTSNKFLTCSLHCLRFHATLPQALANLPATAHTTRTTPVNIARRPNFCCTLEAPKIRGT